MLKLQGVFQSTGSSAEGTGICASAVPPPQYQVMDKAIELCGTRQQYQVMNKTAELCGTLPQYQMVDKDIELCGTLPQYQMMDKAA